MKTVHFALAALAVLAASATPAPAQVVGVILDSPDARQAQGEARQRPYFPPVGNPTIFSAAAARDACAEKALDQAGTGAQLLGQPSAQTMSTGWEVHGQVGFPGDGGSVPFVCSVRNGSVSGILLDQ
ncbi:MAG: hypothetical protein AB7E60_04840 [Sphingobium sp.]